MAITVQSVLTRAANQLNDAGNNRWTTAELLDYVNEGQRAAAVLKPDMMGVTIDLVLAKGTRQSIPEAGFQLLEVQCNIDANGDESTAVRICTRAVLDSLNPDWRNQQNADATVQNYVYEGREPRTFYVYPPQPASEQGTVRVVYARTPDMVTADGNIALPDVLDQALVDYVLFRCFSKDTEADGDATLANAAYQRFAAAIGVKEQVERRDDPNQGMTGFNAPTNPASNK